MNRKVKISIGLIAVAAITFACKESADMSHDSMPTARTENAVAAAAELSPGTTYNNVTWDNGALITKAGTYSIKGICKGMILVSADDVIIEGVSGGKLVDISSTDQVGWPHMIKSTGKNTVVKNLVVQTSFKNKCISLDGSGSNIVNCNLKSSTSEFETGHVQATGTISDCFSSLHDDNYKVRLNGSKVKNSTCVMVDNGCGVTLDYPGTYSASGSGHYAEGVTIKGSSYTGNSGHGDKTTNKANYAMMAAVVSKDVDKVYFTTMNLENVGNFGHIVKLAVDGSATLQDVNIQGTIVSGTPAVKVVKNSSNQVVSRYHAISINAGSGTIKNVVIDLAGYDFNSTEGKKKIFLNGKLDNVKIGTKTYTGTYSNVNGAGDSVTY